MSREEVKMLEAFNGDFANAELVKALLSWRNVVRDLVNLK
jgi:hypothetical protein